MKKASSDAGFFLGGGEEDPTPKLVIANGSLSPLSYLPLCFLTLAHPGCSTLIGFDVMGEQALGVAAVGARATGGLLGGGQYLMVQSRQLVKAQAQLNHVFAQLFEPIGFLHHRAGSVQVCPCWGCWAVSALR